MSQLELSFAPRADLATRLRAAGLPPGMAIILHENRRVLVSRTRAGALRVHRGYQHAPGEVLSAIARWARPRIRREERLAAQRLLIGFRVHDFVPPGPGRQPPGEPPSPGDAAILKELQILHRRFNAAHFGDVLAGVRLSLSGRMARRLGEFRPAQLPGEPHEIVISRRHFRRDGWAGVRVTLLHEMVHQWQEESGMPLGHGPDFRRKCAEVGIEGRAVARSGLDFPQYVLGR